MFPEEIRIGQEAVLLVFVWVDVACFLFFWVVFRGVRRCVQILSPLCFLWVHFVCVVRDVWQYVMQQLVGVEQRISRGDLDRAGAVRFGLAGSEVGHFCFLGCFPWGVMVSSGSFSVVFSSGVFRLCVVRVILNGFLERLVGVIQWVRREV